MLGVGFLSNLFFTSHTFGQVRITVTGDCFLTYDVTDLASGAGSDFNRTKRTDRGDVILEIKGAKINPPFRNWSVDVHKTDGVWGATWTLDVKLTNDGRGNGTINRDTSWHLLSDVPFNLFSGSGNRTNLKPRYRLREVSVQDGIGVFTTTVTYTITEI